MENNCRVKRSWLGPIPRLHGSCCMSPRPWFQSGTWTKNKHVHAVHATLDWEGCLLLCSVLLHISSRRRCALETTWTNDPSCINKQQVYSTTRKKKKKCDYFLHISPASWLQEHKIMQSSHTCSKSLNANTPYIQIHLLEMDALALGMVHMVQEVQSG